MAEELPIDRETGLRITAVNLAIESYNGNVPFPANGRDPLIDRAALILTFINGQDAPTPPADPYAPTTNV